MTELQKVTTKDGTATFMNPEVDSFYHSITGAKEEAVKKYAEACGVDTDNSEKITILDVCFGLGYNSAAAIDAFRGKEIEIIAFERDISILHAMLSIDYPFECKDIMRRLAGSVDINTKNITVRSDKNKIVTVTLHIGDVKNTIKKTMCTADYCFFDPFSPRKQPDLWSEALFNDVYARMKTGGTLATYSCARQVRDNMRAAGFDVRDGPNVGRRAPSTLGVKK